MIAKNITNICLTASVMIALIPSYANADPKDKVLESIAKYNKNNNCFNLSQDEIVHNLKIEFDNDERLFTIMAWLNWVSDIRSEKKQFDEYYELKETLSNLPKDMLIRHKTAYTKYLSNNIFAANFSKIQNHLRTDKSYKYDLNKFFPVLKNALMIYDSQYYDYPENNFTIKKSYIPTEDSQRSKDIPSAELIDEFYRAADINHLWETSYKRANQRMIFNYADDIKKIVGDSLCFLRIEQKMPVSIRFNTLNSFGIAGQTSYSNNEKKYIVKINLEPEYSRNYILQLTRHEVTHTLLNNSVDRYSYLIEDSLKKVAKELNLKNPILSPEELMAQNIENLNYAKSELYVRENVHYYYKNLLFMHFIDKIPDYLASGKSYPEYIPELFSSFNADKEIARWKAIEKRIKKS